MTGNHCEVRASCVWVIIYVRLISVAAWPDLGLFCCILVHRRPSQL